MDAAQPWWSGTVIYQLIVRSYADGNGDGIGDFKGLASRLPYLRWLGVKTLWLTPVYPSPLRDGGYDITAFNDIHPDLGDLASFHRFLTAAHGQGMQVILDLVLNHTSDLHPWFQRARWAAKDSPERNVYVWSDDPRRYADAPVLFRHFEASNWEWDPVAEQYYLHRFLRHQPDLNYANPWVQERMLEVVDFWLERGVDGFRLDAVPFLCEAEGTRCEGLPETHAFLQRLRERVDSHGREILLLGEAIQPVQEAAPYLAENELHGAFNFALTAHLFAAVASGSVRTLGQCLQEAQDAVAGCRWALPLRNHDELWLGDGHLIPDEVIQTIRVGLPQGQGHWLNWGINRRLAPLLNGDPRSNRLLHGLLYSMPGMPCLYYGDELGMGDWPGLRDRDPNRTPMAWTPARNGGFSTAPDPLLVLPPITAPGYDYRVVNVEVQKQLPGSLLNWHRRMLTCRRLLPALRSGGFRLLSCAHPGVIVYVRSTEAMTVLVAGNVTAAGASISLDLSDWDGERTREVMWGCEFPEASSSWFVYLPAYGFNWWLIGEVDAEVAAEVESEPFMPQG
ncbi:MAG: alpha-glucosidase C-terminal domain-containing protein [Synechococcus sp. BS301-5m-G54]|jgi:maltose alpha-D-glucosyltransferase/alpha-amylase|uniref:alpha-amylase family protein n=1 Tax=unclassified Synechococcus TaxID=2626047 RepID=UPI0004E0A8B0|nr:MULTISPECIES: alpha-amylase family protein [unclassified Synechococcus]MBL6740722.1 alpha-glucosidase C-terminal domain-containing protein [Synechococcus sp. BS301-5m-G54]MBL6797106.1 alpha-glucosidase C-terminal domain-containing protein [Synechococcus sp. BS307-5m-G34]RCL52670.1 MAG: trehalose synthase [Synechococcus sp. MED-G70]AII47031.1 trehalose synthase [Synechococcus sp. KORDI-49]QNI93656.1 maltose alpha-D-glucosyltransferase / alpha-amylase [Synechococcus sp. A15-127]|tara:strand:- start:4540 stop:6231 length:1692 start_codon:yes stop_codon:yes gene_type:complete